jgi:hypothetical protein
MDAKLVVDRLYDLRPGRNYWRCCLVPGLLCCRGVSAWCRVATLIVCGLKHSDTFEFQVTKLSHVLVVVRCIGSNV